MIFPITSKKSTRKYYYFLLFYFSILKASSQNYSFINYSTDDGLPTSQIYQVVMDKKGYIWFTSDAGIGRFEMGKIHVLSKQDNLPDNTVFTLVSMDSSRMIGTCYNNSLFELNTDLKIINKTHSNFVEPFEKKQSIIFQTHIIEDTIYTNASYGLFYSKIGKKNVAKVDIKSDAYAEIRVKNKVALLNHDDLSKNSSLHWRSKADPYRIVVDFGNVKKEFFLNTNKEKMMNFNPRAFYIRKNESVAIWLSNEVFILNKDGSVFMYNLPSDVISFYDDNDGDYWVGTRSNGVFVFKDKHLLRKPENLLHNNAVSSVCNDLEGGIWISTLDNGIFYCPSKVFKQINSDSLTGNILKMDDSKGCLYVINSEDHVFKIVNDQYGELRVSKSKVFEKMEINYVKSTGNNLYIGGRSGYVFTNSTIDSNLKVKPPGHGARNILIDKNDSVWVLNYFGLGKMSPHFKAELNLKVGNINAYGMAMDRKERFLIGTIKGLFLYNRKEFLPLLPKNLYLRNRIDYIFIDTKDRNWLSINGIGLGILRDTMFYLVPLKESGINAKINCVVEHQKDFWIGTKNGLYKLNLNEKNGKIQSYNFEFFSKEDGLVSNEINDLKLVGNNLVIATAKGLCYVNISKALKQQQNTPIYLALLNNPLIKNEGSTISIENNLKKVVIEITQPSYRSFKKLRYLYKFSGDKDSAVESSSNITLENLKYGAYKIEVQNYNSVHREGGAGEISFVIKKPIWLEIWFISLVVVFIILFIVMFIKIRINKIRIMDAEKLKVQKLLNEYKMSSLQAQMNPHFIFNAFNSIQQFILTKQTNEAYDYLAKFSKLIRLVLEMSRNSYTSLAKEVELLHLYLEVEQVRTEKKFDYLIEIEPSININTTTLPIMIIQPHVENAIWHGFSHLKDKKGSIIIRITEGEDGLIISIKDNGVGRNESKKYSDSNKRDYKALSTKINQERLNLFESTIEVIDLKTQDGTYEGTEVIIKLNNIDE